MSDNMLLHFASNSSNQSDQSLKIAKLEARLISKAASSAAVTQPQMQAQAQSQLSSSLAHVKLPDDTDNSDDNNGTEFLIIANTKKRGKVEEDGLSPAIQDFEGSSASGNLHQATADARQKIIETADSNKAGADVNKKIKDRGRENSASGRGRAHRVSDQARNQISSPSNGQVENSNHKDDNVIGELQTSKATEFSDSSFETNHVDVPVNVVLRKLLRGPRYFDPPDNSWGACYNCGEEAHTTANCTEAGRKKPCFICGSFEHNANLCSKGRDCFTCKQRGHLAKNCPEMNKSLKICLKCGDIGHDLFSCGNNYFPDDLKELQCYICQRVGHLCCMDYAGLSPIELSCYKCGLSGHTGLACTGCRGDSNGPVSANSCYRCGGKGHFARECTSSLKASKRFRRDINGKVSTTTCYRCGGEGHFAFECTVSRKASKRKCEPSTSKQRSCRKNRNHMQVKSAPNDLGKARKKKIPQVEEFPSAAKRKHRGGWITEDPGDLYQSNQSANNTRSPETPANKRSKIKASYRDQASSSQSPKSTRRLNFSNSASNGSSRFSKHRYSASRFSI